MRQQHNKMREQVKKRHVCLVLYLTIISIYSVYCVLKLLLLFMMSLIETYYLGLKDL